MNQPINIYSALNEAGLLQQSKELPFNDNTIIMKDYVFKDSLLFLSQGIAKIEIKRNQAWEFETLVANDTILGLEHCFLPHKYADKMEYRMTSLTKGTAFIIPKQQLMSYLYAHPLVFHQLIEDLTIRYKFLTFNQQEKKAPLKQRIIDLLMEFVILTHQEEEGEYLKIPFFTEEFITTSLKCSTHHIKHILASLTEQRIICITDNQELIIHYPHLKKFSSIV
ncbi:putative transcriptional regulator [Listeria fleischmannii 1991]|uniref:Uncharacterized protein n=2 Tax=Listeria fleischmannii TaxID=1069827 RepID=A0A2X3H1G3_9LIST|nr:hypothetical protein [Listeria fleischmannii]EMG27824.1 putative cyclic nucleotide-binding proteins (Crp-like) [Listeria fleischmannii subsp. fleischmannii LU2006-1]KMT58549.1 putative transcriptional regulator [Listeria fleischmannii 1991]SQC66391.1 Uncharacterised protein [Listeria fleischmannii subsp. fleischmannii]